MSDEIRMSFVAEDKEMLAAYRRMAKEVEKYKKELSELGKESKKSEEIERQAAKAREEAAKAAAKAAAEAAKAQEKAAQETARANQKAARESEIAAKALAKTQEASAKEAARASEKAARDAAKMQIQAARVAAKESAQAHKDANSQMVSTIAAVAIGWEGIKKAIGLASAELKNYHEIQKNAATETISTADAQIGFLRNLGNVSSADREQVISKINTIAAEVNQPVKNLYVAGQSSISAQGILTQEQMLNSLKLAFQIAPESVDEAKSIAGALGDVASLTGHGDPERNMAFLLEANRQARAETLTAIAKGSLGRAISIKNFGGEGAEALALTNTFSNVMKDPDGQLSSTAALRMASEMNKLKVPGDSTLERIKFLQNNPAEQKRFFDKASFEGGIGVIPAKMVTTKGTEAAQLLEQNVPAMARAGGVGSGLMARGFIEDISRVPEQQVAGLNRAYLAKKSALEVQNLVGAEGGVSRQGLSNVLMASGAGFMERTFQSRMFDLQTLSGVSAQDAAVEQLRARATAIRGMDDNGAVATPRARALNPEDESIAKKLDEMVTQLRGLRKDQKIAPKRKNIDQHAE